MNNRRRTDRHIQHTDQLGLIFLAVIIFDVAIVLVARAIWSGLRSLF
jgi:hypothetical protein